MKHEDIYRGKRFTRVLPDGTPKTYRFEDERWIFACPRCTYIFPFDTREHAEGQRAAHNMSAHQEVIGDINWSDFMGAVNGERMNELAKMLNDDA